MPRGRFREVALVVVTFVALAVVTTWPLWRNPRLALPSDLYDTLLNTWILAWDADRLRHGLAGIWDPPYFFPYHNTLAFSENLFGLAVFVAPVYWITDNAVLTYNVALTIAFVGCGVGMYLLVERLTASRPAAAIAAVCFTFSPFRFAHLTHLQMVATGWIPLGLYALHVYFSTRSRRWLVLTGIAFVLQATTNSYAAYFMAVPLAIVVGDALVRDRIHRRQHLRDLTACALLSALVLAPVAYRYYRVRVDYEQVRLAPDVEKYSADLRSYLVGSRAIGIWNRLPTAEPGVSEQQLFMGIFPILLAGIGSVAALRSRSDRRSLWLYLGIALVGIVLSLGPVMRVWGITLTSHGPYDWLQRTVPGWGGMRVPARFALLTALGLAVLTGFGARAILQRLPARSRWIAVALGSVLVIAESWSVPVTMHAYGPRGRPTDRAVAEWLRASAAGAVLHLPILTEDIQELHYQYATLRHRHPIVNGYSGYQTALQLLWRDGGGPLADFERFGAVAQMIRSLGIRYVIVNPSDYSGARRASGEPDRVIESFRASSQAIREQRLLDAVAFELQPWDRPLSLPGGAIALGRADFTVSVAQADDRAANLVDGDPDTRWFADQDGGTWIAAALPNVSDLAGIELQIAARSLLDYPREIRIESTDAAGVTRTLYEATPYPEFITGFVKSASYPAIVIALPPNATRELRIRETGKAPRWWSVHELRLWKRQ